MSDPVGPVGPVRGRDRRAADRRADQRRAGSTSRELVPLGDIVAHDAPDPARAAAAPPADPGAAVFAAQMIGQTGQRKGLKGGPPVLDAARSAYLETEYSGARERRPPAGKAGSTDV